MIPGIVAGYPRGPVSGTVSQPGTPDSTGAWGFQIGDNYGGVIGSVSPAGMTVYPGGAPNPGGLGEVGILLYGQPSNPSIQNQLVLWVRGTATNWPTAASLPFTAMKINGTTILKSGLTKSGSGTINGTEQFQVFSPSGSISNPFVVGSNTVLFQ